MSHAKNEFLDSQICTLFYDGIKGRNYCFSTFKGKPLLAHKLAVKEIFKDNRLIQLMQDMRFFSGVEIRRISDYFHLLPEPLHPLGGQVVSFLVRAPRGYR